MLLRPAGLPRVLAVVLSGEMLRCARAERVPLHLNHWATCPDREEWRAKQEARAAERARVSS